MPAFVAKTLFGLEGVLAEELQTLGAGDVKILTRAVSFTGDKRMLYKANYHLRTALKILVPVREGEVKNEQDLYQFVRNINWDRYMGVNDTLAIDVAMKTPLFTHTQYIAQKIKDAVVDQFRDKYGSRPSVDLNRPSLRINAYISDRNIVISRDSSGDSLHRRGYRVRQGPAPINEVLAAGLVKLSGWTGNIPLVDFMCGSGTIAIEAAMMALGLPPGDLREQYGFQLWRDYEPSLFNEVAAGEHKTGLPATQIFASDISSEAVKLAQHHARNAGVHSMIRFSTCPFINFLPPSAPGTVIINPPYGERIVQQNLNDLYTSIGDQLKKNYAGFDAWIISNNAEAMKHVGLKPSPKIVVYNGQLECRFNRYSLYAGSKKPLKSSVS